MKLLPGKSFGFVLALILAISSSQSLAQKFKADRYGYVASTEFHELISQRHYQIVSAFDSISIQHQSKVVATVIKDEKPYYLDLDGNELPYVDVTSAIVKEREKWLQKPYKDAEKKYGQLAIGQNERYIKKLVGNTYGLIRKSDKQVILQPEYQWLQCYRANFIVLKKDGQYGVADSLGNVFIKPAYDYIEACMVDTSGIGLFIANKGGLVTLVNRQGKEIFPPKYNKISTFLVDGVLNSITSVNGELRYGLLSKDGKILMEPYCRDFVDITYTNFLRSEKTGAPHEIGLVTKQGNIILEPVYDYVSTSVANGFISFSKDDKWGLIDKNGKIVVNLFYDKLEADSANQVIICALKQQSNKPFTEYKYGLIDYKNKIRVPLEYDEFQKVGKYYLGKKQDAYFLLDKSGKVIHQFAYTYMRYANNNYIAMNKDKLYGVVDITDKVKIPFAHLRIEPVGGYYFVADKGIYTPENELVANANALDIGFTNNLPLRKAGIFAFRQGISPEVLTDRYKNSYLPKNK